MDARRARADAPGARPVRRRGPDDAHRASDDGGGLARGAARPGDAAGAVRDHGAGRADVRGRPDARAAGSARIRAATVRAARRSSGELLSQGFLTSSAPGISDVDVAGHRGRGQMVVVVGGGAVGELDPASARFMEPFVTDLVAAGVVTGAGERLASDDLFVSELRATSTTVRRTARDRRQRRPADRRARPWCWGSHERSRTAPAGTTA